MRSIGKIDTLDTSDDRGMTDNRVMYGLLDAPLLTLRSWCIKRIEH